ncbi:acetyl-CoA C-acetyltransferase [Paenibacillus guangzhouensis]|uniref:acetyl-CoA C-acetyltransferase n=1 Tax=Paenibacillus guangzhouensis TaxID=1473112 RepID=UPI001266A1D3|nr:acetyl-CoA C-acetyltransferase [Paenibacillus guangzhouensis]
MQGTVIISGARTAFGKFGGMWRDIRAIDLGAAAIRGALQRSALEPADVDGVFMGMALQAGAGQSPARQAALKAGLPHLVTAETVNKVCASGLRAVTLVDQMIRAGDGTIYVAGGMENMSQVPYAAQSMRWGARLGPTHLVDLIQHDGLLCAYEQVLMAQYGDDAARAHGITRAEQDEWALRSHLRAVAAMTQGKFSDEIFPVPSSIALRESDIETDTDECPRKDTDLNKLTKLQPIVGTGGTVTPGNAPGVNDGAAALLVMSKEEVERRALKPLAEIVGHATIGLDARHIAEAPAVAIQKLLQKTGHRLSDIDLFEINEAFAAVILTCSRMIPVDLERVNVNGGAIALGHPLGASGVRILWSLIMELRRKGGGLGVAAICSGGAHGDAIMVRVDG